MSDADKAAVVEDKPAEAKEKESKETQEKKEGEGAEAETKDTAAGDKDMTKDDKDKAKDKEVMKLAEVFFLCASTDRVSEADCGSLKRCSSSLLVLWLCKERAPALGLYSWR